MVERPAVAAPAKKSEPHLIANVDIPDLKGAVVCLATTKESSEDRLEWTLTCLDKSRKFLVRERRIATEKPAGEDEMTYGDLEITVELQNRGFRLVSTQDGLFFTKI